MTTLASATTAAPSITKVQQEVDRARAKGPLREIVVPPCPELLVRLQAAMTPAEPDLTEVGRIASADVAPAFIAAIATSPEPDATSITRLPRTVSGWSNT